MTAIRQFKEMVRLYSTKYKLFIICYAIIAGLAGLNEVSIMLLEGQMSEAIVQTPNASQLDDFFLMLTILAISRIFLDGFKTFISERKHSDIFKLMQQKSFSKLTNLNQANISKIGIGGIVSLFQNDMTSATNFIAGRILDFISGLIGICITLVFLFKIDWIITISFLAMFFLSSLIQNKASKSVNEAMGQVSVDRGKYNTLAADMLYNNSLIEAYELTEYVESKFNNRYQDYYESNKLFLKKLISSLLIGETLSKVPLYLTYSLSAIFTIQSYITFSELIFIIAVVKIQSGWLSMVMENIVFIKRDYACALRVKELLEEETNNIADKVYELNISEPAIELKNVKFGYNDTVFNGCNLTVSNGQHVAIIGQSGTGKSTLLKLILGLEEKDGGTIKIFGASQNPYSIKSIRNAMSYVSQNYYLFPMSIEENLLINSECTNEDLINALKRVDMFDKVESLKLGVNTIVVDGGSNFSGGERQRLALARALIKEKPVVLLDEPTSALDKDTAKIVKNLLLKEFKDKTVIIATHDYSFLEHVDKVYLMKDKKLYEK